MFMDSLLSMLFFLFTFFSFNPASSYASKLSYKDHCASIVPESSSTKHSLNSFPLGDHHTGYYTGGDSITGADTSWDQFSFQLQPRKILATQVSNLFQVKATISFKSSTNTYNNISYGGSRFSYGGGSRDRRGYLTFKLEGFWSESSGKICMVGTSSGYYKRGNSLNLDAVFKLSNVFNASNINSLVSGSLESLSSKMDENYFEPFSLLMLPKANYKYTLDSIEATNDCSSGIDAEQGLSLNLNKLSFCSSYPLMRVIRGLKLEYSSDCNSAKNCTPLGGSSGQLQFLMSLEGIECTHTEKHRLRVVVSFLNDSYYGFNPSFNPKTMLVGEGWWDEKKNTLCVVACHIIGMESSLAGPHVSDCSVRLRLRFPSIWSIKNTSTIEGQIWSNKPPKDQGYFKRITFRSDENENHRVQRGAHGLKYEYSQLDRVKKSCQTPKDVKEKGKRYPDAYSYDMRFDMSVRESNKRVAWGYAAPLTVDDQFYGRNGFYELEEMHTFSDSFSTEVLNNDSVYNISYKVSMSPMSHSSDRNSLFNTSSWTVKISAEGIYDAGAGILCMVGCRDLSSNNGTPKAHSVDCDILMKFQFPSVDTIGRSRIKGSIVSTRKESDPLYFKSLDLSATAYYIEGARRNVWRMDMEVIMALVSTTLACVFVGLQLYHVKKHPNVLPFISLIMMSILTLGYMIPLVLNFEALLTQNPNNKNFVLGNVGMWLEVNEVSVRFITMVAFLLQSRLLYLTWSSRKNYESNKGLERKAAYVTLPLYAAGLLIALLLKLKKDRDQAMFGQVYQQNSSSWDNFKSYGGLVLDGFLLPQIILNLFSNMEENVLSCSFYFGTTFVRLLPHAYDFYRAHNYASEDDNGSYSYYYADPSADFYSTAWDIVIPLGGILFAILIYLQQRFGGHFILPRRFKGSKIYEKVPVVTGPEAEVETTNM